MKNNSLVFIIDDDIIQNEIHELLIKKSFPEKEVHTFNNSEDALAAIDNQLTPAIIFLDLHLPGESKTFFLDEYNKRQLKCDVYLMSSMAYLEDSSILTKYSQLKDFISKPLLEQKLKAVFYA